MPKRLRIYLDLELTEEDPYGKNAAELLTDSTGDIDIYLYVGHAEFEVSDLHVHGLVDEARP
jgi:hypothetical protein